MLFLTLALATSSLLGVGSNPPDRSAKPNMSIVDTGGGGISLSWRDAGNDGPGPRWLGK